MFVFFAIMLHMNNKTMVITGAASGLGKAIALAAANNGYDVAVADVQQQAGEQTVKEIRELGRQADYFNCDVSQEKALLDLKDQVLKRFGHVDVLVNNAGVGAQGTVCDSTEEQWNRQLQINLMGVVRGCQAFIPQLKKRPDAAVVNVASFAAIALAPGVASYNVAKAGVVALSETLRCELADTSVHVSVLCPAFFKTNLTQSMHDADDQVKNQINRWMDRSKYSAVDVAQMVLDGIKRKQFMILCDQTTRWQYRISRWFPNYFYKQKVKIMKRMFK
jgi:NAD(P)-dependent dehydrogenase (short-subunit alcohol dehydrogenase family)